MCFGNWILPYGYVPSYLEEKSNFIQPRQILMACTHSLCLQPHFPLSPSPAHATPATPVFFLFLNLPSWLLPWGPYTCRSLITLKSALSWQSIFSIPMSPLLRGHSWSPLSNHHNSSTFPETHSISLYHFTDHSSRRYSKLYIHLFIWLLSVSTRI